MSPHLNGRRGEAESTSGLGSCLGCECRGPFQRSTVGGCSFWKANALAASGGNATFSSVVRRGLPITKGSHSGPAHIVITSPIQGSCTAHSTSTRDDVCTGNCGAGMSGRLATNCCAADSTGLDESSSSAAGSNGVNDDATADRWYFAGRLTATHAPPETAPSPSSARPDAAEHRLRPAAESQVPSSTELTRPICRGGLVSTVAIASSSPVVMISSSPVAVATFSTAGSASLSPVAIATSSTSGWPRCHPRRHDLFVARRRLRLPPYLGTSTCTHQRKLAL